MFVFVCNYLIFFFVFFFFQAEDGIRDLYVTGVQTCALPISMMARPLNVRTTPVAGHASCGWRCRRGGRVRATVALRTARSVSPSAMRPCGAWLTMTTDLSNMVPSHGSSGGLPQPA